MDPRPLAMQAQVLSLGSYIRSLEKLDDVGTLRSHIQEAISRTVSCSPLAELRSKVLIGSLTFIGQI